MLGTCIRCLLKQTNKQILLSLWLKGEQETHLFSCSCNTPDLKSGCRSPQLQPALAGKKNWAPWSLTDLTWLFPPFLPSPRIHRKCCQLYLQHKLQISPPWFYHPEPSHPSDSPTSTLVAWQPILHPVARPSQRDFQSDLITPWLKACLWLCITPRMQSKLLPFPQGLHHRVTLLSLLSQLTPATYPSMLRAFSKHYVLLILALCNALPSIWITFFLPRPSLSWLLLLLQIQFRHHFL